MRCATLDISSALTPFCRRIVGATIVGATLLRALALLWIMLAMGAPACAHTTDTSYARVRIFDDHLEIRLTCDVFTLQRIVPDLDANRDAALSREELRSATPAVQKFFAAHVGMEIDRKPANLGVPKDPFWPLDAPDPIPASLWHANDSLVSFPFDIPLSAPAKNVALIFNVFGVLGERHTVLGVFEYRGQPTEVVFTEAEPDYEFDMAFLNESPVLRFFKMGIEHILTGYDHLCFLLALIVVSRLRPLIAIVTSFTVAHSITLLLAAFGIVRLPTRMIECGIALTIVYVAVENLWRREYGHRWMLTFFFGLIHGFGFANTLDPQQLPIDAKAKCLVVFNLGVEAGQLAVVLALLPLSIALAKWKHGARGKIAISIVVALLGLAWFVDRAFDLRRMPF